MPRMGVSAAFLPGNMIDTMIDDAKEMRKGF